MFIKLLILILNMNKVMLTIILVVMTVFAGCNLDTGTTESQESSQRVVASFYPVEEITRALFNGSEDFEVIGLIPKGSDPHSYEPTPRQLQELSKAEVFVTMGGMFEHIEQDVLEVNPNIKVIESTHFLGDIEFEEHDHAHDDEHGHEESSGEEQGHNESHETHDNHEESHEAQEEHEEHGPEESQDPHIWLSIHNMEKMTDEIAEHLIEQYPLLEEEIKMNSQEYKGKLESLEKKYEEGLKTCNHNEIIVNHKAFGYLAQEYGFKQISVSGFSPESEPTPKTIQAVIDEAKEHNLSYVFSEGQFSENAANTIANDIGGEVLEINPVLQERHTNYFELMEENLENLKLGLECE